MAEHTIDELLAMPKKVDEPKTEFEAPSPGDTVNVKLMSPVDTSCRFTLSIYEGKRSSSITLAIDSGRKTSIQTRHRSDALVRVDIDEKAKHTNPDDSIVEGSHVHIAREGYGCRWAYPFDSDEAIMVIGSSGEVIGIFECFREYCNIERDLLVNWKLEL